MAVDTDVILIGAGPVGLLLANLLGAAGIRTRVFDLRETPLESSMAIGVTPPSMEILRRLGLDAVFLDAGVPVRHAEVHESRTRLGRLDFAGLQSDYRFFLSIPQARTVEILQTNLRKYPSVELAPGMEFTGLMQDRDGICVTVRQVSSGVERTLRSHILVGCDGHRSAVRSAARLTVREKMYAQRFVMGDCLDRSGLGTEARLFFTPEASVESFPLPGGWRRWIVLAPDLSEEAPESLFGDVAAGISGCRRGRHLAARKNRPPVETPAFHNDFPGGDAVPPGWKPRLYVSQDGRRHNIQTGSEEYLVRTVKRLAGFDLEDEPLRFVSTFGAKRMLVNRYHAGRVVLAGDAAHTMSSIGGQGMNTGFADAEMLAALLPGVLAAPQSLAARFAVYDRVRRTAYKAAADRAERGMWLGTLRGRPASLFRHFVIRKVLFSRFLERHLAPHFAMLTIPFCNLNHVPPEWLTLL